jgi:hypothetical protein
MRAMAHGRGGVGRIEERDGGEQEGGRAGVVTATTRGAGEERWKGWRRTGDP